ncbi:LysR family transcriptional regulator [Marinimicrobium sp. ABcell2]|uniref:LysR family transcriptional regulator n=1 Tax=Marinimicrobium sp. ABcell2 TaxID=3069751 RepID=UPI0027B09E72|nr:LysR family transcriptional regulator [Marinimicrobium sp. ABcell2]MDQ2077812.1 LysR family transcriptional regulator [Marinimicrobium sp. ABcell2]
MDLRHLSFRLLQVYLQVVRTGSISEAARSLHLTQPTVSLQMKKLTETVGEPLLEMQDGKLAMTAVGSEFYRATCDVMGRFEDFGHTLEEARQGQWGHVKLGVVTTAKYVIPRILGGFYQHRPKVDITLNIGNRARILERFSNQEDDLYLFSHPPSGQHVRATAIIRNPLQLIAPKGHWAAEREAVDFSELKGERFLMREPGSATRMAFDTWLSARGLELNNTQQIESNEVIRLSVASGLGLAVLSAHTLDEGREKLVQLPVQGFPLESNWYLVSRRDRRLSQAAQALVEYMATDLTRCIEPAWVSEDLRKLLGPG